MYVRTRSVGVLLLDVQVADDSSDVMHAWHKFVRPDSRPRPTFLVLEILAPAVGSGVHGTAYQRLLRAAPR